MSKYKPVIVFILCFSFILYSKHSIAAQETDINKLISEVSVDSQKGAMFGYTYFMRFSYSHHKKFGFGRKFTRLYEAILPLRFSLKRTYRHPFVLIQDSEKLITAQNIADMRKDLVKELERAESEDDGQNDKKPESRDGGYWTISFSANQQKVKIDIIKLLENSQFRNLQRRQIEGRNVFLIDFSPKSEAVFEKSLLYLGKIEGQIWIDEADKRITRIEAFPSGKLEQNREKPDIERQQEAVFLFAQTRVAEGFWFPQDVVLNFTKNPEIFDTVKIEFNFEKYKRASVEIKSDIEAPKEAGADKN